MTDYHVVPAALRNAVTKLDEAAGHWGSAHGAIRDHYMGQDTLGLLGRLKNTHEAYNRALDTVQNRLGEGSQRLTDAGSTLNEVAKHYESVDADEYRKFNYIDEKLGR
ncbi:hypothetical protein [Actinokineospora iranica]|uniref:Excreted virulence factor EspC, type VII ESX diderm n=1 Tax=Actinokineospora iranica TaxID=1271860 RepID=A0A1G6QY20_9PSEU|nr:hypothetical protein [Actinokineospora iranica]SDC97198.1 hypothetical protein SAMN05216174_10630 [Actinokineospora iranica]